ncbi:hypothetical protein M2168_003062 [Streptomyces sp. CZ24]|nr:hypothetical protein [Streptomyces sp. CZ24]
MAPACATRPSPLITPEAAGSPNRSNRSRAFDARSSSDASPAPRNRATSCAASFAEATIWSPESTSATTTMYVAPPTTTSTAAQVSPAASDRCTFIASSRRCKGVSSAVPSSASSTGMTAARNNTHSHTATHATPATSSSTAHHPASRTAPSGSTPAPRPPPRSLILRPHHSTDAPSPGACPLG